MAQQFSTSGLLKTSRRKEIEIFIEFDYKGSKACIRCNADELGLLVESFENALLSLAILHPELLGDVYERIIRTPEDGEVMDIIKSEPGFRMLNYCIPGKNERGSSTS